MQEMIDILIEIKQMMYYKRPRKSIMACLAMAMELCPNLRDCAGDFGYFELLPMMDKIEKRKRRKNKCKTLICQKVTIFVTAK